MFRSLRVLYALFLRFVALTINNLPLEVLESRPEVVWLAPLQLL